MGGQVGAEVASLVALRAHNATLVARIEDIQIQVTNLARLIVQCSGHDDEMQAADLVKTKEETTSPGEFQHEVAAEARTGGAAAQQVLAGVHGLPSASAIAKHEQEHTGEHEHLGMATAGGTLEQAALGIDITGCLAVMESEFLKTLAQITAEE